MMWLDRKDGRDGAPILPVERWDSRLVRGGFNGCEFIKHDQDGPSKTTSLIVSKAIPMSQEKPLPFPSHLIHDNSETIRSLLGQKIQKLYFQSSVLHSPSQEIFEDTLYVIIGDKIYGSILESSSKIIHTVMKVIALPKLRPPQSTKV